MLHQTSNLFFWGLKDDNISFDMKLVKNLLKFITSIISGENAFVEKLNNAY